MDAANPTVAFAPGRGTGLVAWPTIALIESVEPGIAERLWAALLGGADGNDLIEELSVNGLRQLGSFAIAQVEGAGLRLFVRGGATVRVVGGTGPVEIDGASVRTWVEQLVVDCRSIQMVIGGSIGSDEPFKVTSGLVPTDRLSWSFDDSGPTAAPPSDDGQGVSAESGAGFEPPSPTDGTDGPVRSEPESDASGAALDPEVVDTGETLHFESFDDDSAGEREVEGGSPPDPPDVPTGADVDTDDPDGAAEYDYDALFGRTTHRSVQDAAVAAADDEDIDRTPSAVEEEVREEPPPSDGHTSVSSAAPTSMISSVPHAVSTSAVPESSPQAQSPDQAGDHDGLTMTVAQLRALRASGGQPDGGLAEPAVGAPGRGTMVQALVCASGHANPTVHDVCRRCGGPLTSPQVSIARPSLGRVLLSTGQEVELTRSAIVGRNPRIEGTMHGEVPSTVKIEGNQALSRSHAIIRLEGWQVMVEDLDSANGTTVTLQGRQPRRLRTGEPIILEHGALIDFGGEVTGTYDALV